MSYELRKQENEKHKCPKCGGKTVKFGSMRGKKRRRCNDCSKVYFSEAVQIRVGIASERSVIVEIIKPYDNITSADIQEKIPNKRIIGWCKVEKSLSTQVLNKS